jgi:cilia- and flagella-associated protein 57
MRITNDDKFLITAGRDGCVLVYEIKDKDARDGKYKEGYSKASDEILVTR